MSMYKYPGFKQISDAGMLFNLPRAWPTIKRFGKQCDVPKAEPNEEVIHRRIARLSQRAPRCSCSAADIGEDAIVLQDQTAQFAHQSMSKS